MQIERSESQKASVEFYPTLDDFVHISLRIGEKASQSTLTTRAYYLFLIVNAIGFPAFLLFREHFVIGFLVFLANLSLLMLIVPRVNRQAAASYYQKLLGDRERKIARVELSSTGILYSADDGYSFWPWSRITSTEETETSIFFYFDGNGIAIQKSGFPYVEEQKAFLDFARSQMRTALKLDR